METLVAYPQNEAQETALKAIFKALNVPFDEKKTESPYNPEFVKKVEEGEKQFLEGRGIKKNIADLWK